MSVCVCVCVHLVLTGLLPLLVCRAYARRHAHPSPAVQGYWDVYLPQRTHGNAAELRAAYVAHVLTHALDTRTRVRTIGSSVLWWYHACI